MRRFFKQASCEKIYVHDDGEVTRDLAEPPKTPTEPELPARPAMAMHEGKLPDWLDSGSLSSNDDGLVNDEAAGSNRWSWWAQQDSNLRPIDYESTALTN